MNTAILWFPAGAVAAHIFEEFVWPGGFAAWYRRYPPGQHVIVSSRFLVLMNTILAAMALLPPVLGPTPRGLAFWMVVVAITAANAVFHIHATVRTRVYSPGVFTSVVIYLPLALIVGARLMRDHFVPTSTVVQALVVAIGYQMWSSWTHRRHALAVSAD